MKSKKPVPKGKGSRTAAPAEKKLPPLAMLGVAMPKGKAKGKKGC